MKIENLSPRLRGAVRTTSVLGFIAVVALLVGTTQFAAADTAATTYVGCVSSPGQLRVVANANQCRNGESVISWNSVGPEGPAGPAGPQGPSGVTATRLTSVQSAPIPPGDQASVVASCNPDEILLSGGFAQASTGANLMIITASPVNDIPTVRRYVAEARNTGTAPLSITATALCVRQ